VDDERTIEDGADEREYEPPAVTEVGSVAGLTRGVTTDADSVVGDG
jgi:hypothetical protein